MSSLLFVGLCRRLKFSTKIDEYALQFHVIKKFHLSIYVGQSVPSACTHRCIMDPVCVSVNIGPPNATDEKFICELSNSDHMKHPEDLKKREGFLYINTEVIKLLWAEDMFVFDTFNNPLLTEREGRTREYWPEIVTVREVLTKMTEGQYSPVRLELARLVSTVVTYYMALRQSLFWICRLSKTKNTQLMTVSTETVHMAKSRPRKNQSERSDLPCHILILDI